MKKLTKKLMDKCWKLDNKHYTNVLLFPGGKRNGATAEKAYNGTSETAYYQTPIAFFSGGVNGKDPADTAQGAVWVLNKDGQPRKTKASGIRIMLPSIPGVGILRQRYVGQT